MVVLWEGAAWWSEGYKMGEGVDKAGEEVSLVEMTLSLDAMSACF